MGPGANSNVLKRRLAVHNVLRSDGDADLSAPGACRLLGERGARPGERGMAAIRAAIIYALLLLGLAWPSAG